MSSPDENHPTLEEKLKDAVQNVPKTFEEVKHSIDGKSNDNFFNAISQGDIEKVSKLISENKSYVYLKRKKKMHDKNEHSGIAYAADKGQFEILKLLHSHGAKFKEVNLLGMTPLLFACRGPSFDCVKFLVEQGGDVNDADSNGMNCLMYASRFQNRIETIKFLLENGADPHHEDNNKWSLEQHAARGNNVEIMEFLISNWDVPRSKAYEQDPLWSKLVAAASMISIKDPVKKKEHLKKKSRDAKMSLRWGRDITAMIVDDKTPAFEDESNMHTLQYLIQVRPIHSILGLVEKLNWSGDSLRNICCEAIKGSDSPILLLLKFYEILMVIGKRDQTLFEEFSKISNEFTRAANRLFIDIPSDHFAAWVLEENRGGQCGEFESVLSCAIRSQNFDFINNPRVGRIANFWWSNSWDGYFDTNGWISGSFPNESGGWSFLNLFLTSPHLAYNIAKMRYLMKVVCFVILVLLATIVVVESIPVNESNFRLSEWCLYVYTAGFLYEEFRQLWDQGFFRYFNTNYLDIMLMFALVFSYIARLVGKYEAFYIMSMDSIIILTWIRLLFIVRHFNFSKSIGSLLVVLKNIMHDVGTFMIMLLTFTIGFLLAFRFTIGSTEEKDWSSTWHMFLTLYSSALSNEMEKNFNLSQDFSPERKAIAEVLSVLYLSLFSILLVNLLIAMMAHTFEEIKSSSEVQAAFSKIRTIKKYDHDPGKQRIFAPFNLVVVTLFIIFMTGYYIYYLFTGCKEEKYFNKAKWRCARCKKIAEDEVRIMKETLSKDAIKEKNRPSKTQKRVLLNQKQLDSLIENLVFRIRKPIQKEAASEWLRGAIGIRICPSCLRARREISTPNRAYSFLTFITFLLFFWLPSTPLFIFLYIRKTYNKSVREKNSKMTLAYRNTYLKRKTSQAYKDEEKKSETDIELMHTDTEKREFRKANESMTSVVEVEVVDEDFELPRDRTRKKSQFGKISQTPHVEDAVTSLRNNLVESEGLFDPDEELLRRMLSLELKMEKILKKICEDDY